MNTFYASFNKSSVHMIPKPMTKDRQPGKTPFTGEESKGLLDVLRSLGSELLYSLSYPYGFTDRIQTLIAALSMQCRQR